MRLIVSLAKGCPSSKYRYINIYPGRVSSEGGFCKSESGIRRLPHVFNVIWILISLMRLTSPAFCESPQIIFSCAVAVHTSYSETCRETTAMRDHLSWQTTHLWQKDLHFKITETVTRDHLSWQIWLHFCGQWGGLSRQVLLYYHMSNSWITSCYHMTWDSLANQGTMPMLP